MLHIYVDSLDESSLFNFILHRLAVYYFEFANEDGCWSSETCFANLKLCAKLSLSYFSSATSSQIEQDLITTILKISLFS